MRFRYREATLPIVRIERTGSWTCNSYRRCKVFADGLVQAAAIADVEETAQLLADWVNGKPVLLHECTVLNDVHLTAPVSPSEEIQLVPLGLRITEQGVEAPEFPRLPIGWNISLGDYFGLTLLKLSRSAAPALFHPNRETNGQVVPSVSVDGIALDRACEALSLLANWHVSPSVVWHDYPDAAPFCLEIRDTWSNGGNRVRRMGQDNPVAVTLEDDARFQDLDRNQLRRTLQALTDADKKLRIALDRWRRSVPGQPNLRLEDQCIDLRIALEMLFLKDFANARSQEMRLRLSVFGAWYLADDIEERRRIRNVKSSSKTDPGIAFNIDPPAGLSFSGRIFSAGQSAPAAARVAASRW